MRYWIMLCFLSLEGSLEFWLRFQREFYLIFFFVRDYLIWILWFWILEDPDFLSTWKFFHEIKLFRVWASHSRRLAVFSLVRGVCARKAHDGISRSTTRFLSLHVPHGWTFVSLVSIVSHFSVSFSPPISPNLLQSPEHITYPSVFPSDVSFREESVNSPFMTSCPWFWILHVQF